MSRKSLFVVIVMLAALLASAPAVLAQTDCKTVISREELDRFVRLRRRS